MYTAFNRKLFVGLCNIFKVLYCTGAPFFGQSEIKLAFSVFPHCGESSMRTPLWRTGLVCNAGTTQSKAGSANTNGLVQELAIWKCICYVVNKRKKLLLYLSVPILPACFSEVQPPFRFCFLLWYTEIEHGISDEEIDQYNDKFSGWFSASFNTDMVLAIIRLL